MTQFDNDNTKFIKFNDNLNNYYYFSEYLTNEDIENLDKLLDNVILEEGNVAGIVDKTYRSSKIKWIPKTDTFLWLYNKMGYCAYTANINMWNFDISYMNENIQYTEYDESYSGKYDWHIDIGSDESSLRKIALVVQLSGPDEYEGGELQLYKKKDIDIAPKKKGTVICFPTYFLHRVTPVTKGKRRSLVLWVSGNPFR